MAQAEMITNIDPPMKVKYVGGKPEKSDTVAGSGYVWKKDESLMVPTSVGKRLVKFRGVWEEVALKKEERVGGINVPAGTMSSARKLDNAFSPKEEGK